MDLLWAAGEVVVRHGGPWMLGADFNMTPEELAQATGWLATVGGVFQAPTTPTCRSLNGGRTIDFVVLDNRLAAVESIWTDLCFPGSLQSCDHQDGCLGV